MREQLMRWRRAVEDHPFTAMQKAMSEMMTEEWPSWPTAALAASGSYLPHLDVSETDEAIDVMVEIPGMSQKDISVSLTGGVLTIQGEKRMEKEDKRKNFYRMERSYGTFHRNVTLPCEVDPEKVQATYKDGVLGISLSKSKAAKQSSRKIDVKAG